MMNVTIELKKKVSAVPIRMMVEGEFPTYLTRTIIKAAGISDPMKALVTTPALDMTEENEKPMIMAVTAPKHAPEDIPVV